MLENGYVVGKSTQFCHWAYKTRFESTRACQLSTLLESIGYEGRTPGHSESRVQMWKKRKLSELKEECALALACPEKEKQAEIIERRKNYHGENTPMFHVVENEVNDLFRPTKEGPGLISDLYSTHFSTIDHSNANFYKVRPRPTRWRDAKRIYANLSVICALNVHGLNIARREKNKETPLFPSPKTALEELATKMGERGEISVE